MRRSLFAGVFLLAACAAPPAHGPATGSHARPAADAGAPAASASENPAIALEQEIETVARRAAGPGTLWPGFDPLAVPLAVYDGRKTWFFRHPSPPAGCEAVPGPPAACVLDGRHEAMTANSSAGIAGVETATVLLDGRGRSRPIGEQAALAIHEDFHVFQRTRHPKWVGNEADLFTYPVDSVDLLALRRLETEALRLALQAAGDADAVPPAGDADLARCRARLALALRTERYGRMDVPFAAYERGTELNEGLAAYIQTRAAGRTTVEFPKEEFGPAAIRPRTYVTGPALALLLDRFDPGWKDRLEAQDDGTLDGLLGKALGPGETAACRFDEETGRRAREQARDDIAVRASDLAQRLAAFETKPGWRIIVEAAEGKPLRTKGFDPLNVERIAATRVLHTRYVALGNDAGTMEVMEAEALTDGAGPHPLFGGIRRVVVTGLNQPEVSETGGTVHVKASGVTLDFKGATVTRDGEAMTIRLGGG